MLQPKQNSHIDLSAIDPDWAWAPYEPGAERPWNLPLASHLLRRAGFAGNWQQLQQTVADGPARTVERLLSPPAENAQSERSLNAEWPATVASVDELSAWWLRRMILSPHPLLEKMTLLWHGHFALQAASISETRLIQQHLQLLREHALGRFSALLEALVVDPAMLIAFEAKANRKALPNQNLARQLLNTTVGHGNYTTDDLQAAARSLTGCYVLGNQFRFIEREHDTGHKTILGQTGPWKAEDFVRIVARHPLTARFIARKFFGWFVCEDHQPGDELLAPVAATLSHKGDIAELLAKILRSNLFYSRAVYRRRVKSPVEFVVGLVRAMEATIPTMPLVDQLGRLGQKLFGPPTADGWAGGKAWITPDTVIGRNNLAAAILAASGAYAGKVDPLAVAARYGRASPDGLPGFLMALLIDDQLPSEVRRRLLAERPPAAGPALTQWARQFVQQIVTIPEYQLA